VNKSGQGEEGEAHLDENQNKENDRDLINNEAEAREVVSELVRKYPLKMLKKIGFELGNAITAACDVSREPGGVGNVDSLGVNELELQVGGEIHNTEMNLELGCSEPSLKPSSQVETGLGGQDGSMDNVVCCKEHVISMLPVVNVETVNDAEEGADKQCQVTFDCIDNGPAQVYSGEQIADVGHGRVTNSKLRDVDEEAVDDVEQATDQEVQLPLDCNENEAVVTDDELVEEATSTQPEVQDSIEGCVKKVQSKKESFSGQEDDFSKKPLKMSRMNRDDGAVQLKKRPFSCQEDGCQKKFGYKTHLNEHITAVHHKKKPFSCKEEGCLMKFAHKRKLVRHVNGVHLKKKHFPTQPEVQDSSEGCVKKAQPKKGSLSGRSFSCQEGGCLKKFPRMSCLNRHVTFVHLKKRPFPCQEDGCQKKFRSKVHLDEHITAVHHKKKPLSCKEEGCHMKFSVEKKLVRHVNEVHLKMRSFSCKENGCQEKFRRKEHLSRHIKIVHQKKKAFICQESGCGRKFGRKHELPDHMRSAHGAPKLVCKKAECSATFVWAPTLSKHMRENH